MMLNLTLRRELIRHIETIYLEICGRGDRYVHVALHIPTGHRLFSIEANGVAINLIPIKIAGETDCQDAAGIPATGEIHTVWL